MKRKKYKTAFEFWFRKSTKNKYELPAHLVIPNMFLVVVAIICNRHLGYTESLILMYLMIFMLVLNVLDYSIWKIKRKVSNKSEAMR